MALPALLSKLLGRGGGDTGDDSTRFRIGLGDQDGAPVWLDRGQLSGHVALADPRPEQRRSTLMAFAGEAMRQGSGLTFCCSGRENLFMPASALARSFGRGDDVALCMGDDVPGGLFGAVRHRRLLFVAPPWGPGGDPVAALARVVQDHLRPNGTRLPVPPEREAPLHYLLVDDSYRFPQPDWRAFLSMMRRARIVVIAADQARPTGHKAFATVLEAVADGQSRGYRRYAMTGPAGAQTLRAPDAKG
ncbi:hypothetical protein HHL28_02030 [Aerophototrophica crusticola]|uniref:Uncharacterized protein n=1 Tax=Aerophototrophica crusticola TaxID=1709002 RepID=A0A858R4C7_9PROT|nr:hypothetical protein HHL28_02030 [Rhodospirillaceae bacterium B3]